MHFLFVKIQPLCNMDYKRFVPLKFLSFLNCADIVPTPLETLMPSYFCCFLTVLCMLFVNVVLLFL